MGIFIPNTKCIIMKAYLKVQVEQNLLTWGIIYIHTYIYVYILFSINTNKQLS